jgi:hypothetical protein
MASSSRSDLVRMAAVLAALLVVTGAVLLLTGGGSGDRVSESATVDGRLTVVEQTRLVLQPNDGGPQQTFSIRPTDVARLDLPHLETHAADQLPSRVFYETEGSTRYAVRVDDLPPS